MAKKGITLPREDWELVYGTFCGNPSMGDTEAQARRAHLWAYLEGELQREDEPLTIRLTSPQRRILLSDLENPARPWRTDAKYTRIWGIQEKFGWQRPDLSEFDEDDEDQEEDQ
jgi:hypothetical protein